MLNNYICAVDIGSSKISAVVAEIKKRHMPRVFLESMPAKGIKRGLIIDSVVLIESISNVLKNLKVKSGINIKSIYTNISGQDIVTRHSRAIIPLAERGNKVITLSDLEQVNEQARILGSSLEEEIIHQIPFSYTIDSQSNIANPLGLYSHRLEVDLYLICAKLSSIQNLTRVINQSGYEIKGLFFSGLATSKAILNEEFKEGINIFCDIGSDITELLVFEDSMLKDIKVLLFGGDDLTLELSQELKISFDLAEDIKRSYALVGEQSQIGENKEILVKKHNIYMPIKQRLVSEMITAKTKLFCNSLKDNLEKMIPCGEINNFVTTGRTILLEGFLETLENSLGVAVKLGRIINPDIKFLTNQNDALSGHKHLTYLTSLGMLCEVLEKSKSKAISYALTPQNFIFNAINRLKEIYQEYF